MSIAFGTAGAVAPGTTSVSVAYPSSIAAGDLLLLVATAKYNAYSGTPTGFTLLHERVGGSGGTGVDAGNVRTAVWYRIADGSEPASVTISKTSETGSAILARMFRYTRDAGFGWDLLATSGVSSSGGTGWSAGGSNNIHVASGDVMLCASGVNTDAATFSLHSAEATGATFAVATERQDSSTNNGHDIALLVTEHACTAGASTAAPGFASTGSAGTPDGSTVFVRIRESAGITAEQGSHSLTGQDASFLRTLLFSVDQGSYALTGNAATFDTGTTEALAWFSSAWVEGAWKIGSWYEPLPNDFPFSVAQGSYLLNGQAAALAYGRLFGVDQGSFELSGQDAGLYKGYKVVAAQGSYALTGQAATFPRTYVLTAETGSYTLTGFSAQLDGGTGRAWAEGAWKDDAWYGTVWSSNSSAPLGLQAQTGYYGQPQVSGRGWFTSAWVEGAWNTGAWTDGDIQTGLYKGYRLTAETGYYTYTGDDALRDILMVAGEGSYALSGQDVGVNTGLFVTADRGSYGLTGQAATFKRGLRMTAQFGAFLTSGSDVAFIVGVGEHADAGSYALTGYPATLTVTRGLQADVGSYALNGQDARLVQGGVFDADQGAYTLTGFDVSFSRAYYLSANPGYYTVGGQLASPVVATTTEERPAGGWWVGPRQRTKKEIEEERVKFGVLPKPVQKAVRRAAKKVVEGVDSKEEAAELLSRIARGERVSDPAIKAEIKRASYKWNPKYGKATDAVVADSLLNREAEEAAELEEIAELFFNM
jgi:hypothetical protein